MCSQPPLSKRVFRSCRRFLLENVIVTSHFLHFMKISNILTVSQVNFVHSQIGDYERCRSILTICENQGIAALLAFYIILKGTNQEFIAQHLLNSYTDHRSQGMYILFFIYISLSTLFLSMIICNIHRCITLFFNFM